jgi:hypothetical protein
MKGPLSPQELGYFSQIKLFFTGINSLDIISTINKKAPPSTIESGNKNTFDTVLAF